MLSCFVLGSIISFKMSHIEELPDEFDESLDIGKAPTTKGAASLRDLYEQRLDTPNSFSDKSFEEVMYDMSKTPLFMNDKDVLAVAGRLSNHAYKVARLSKDHR